MPSSLTNWLRLDLARLIALVLESLLNGVFWTFFYQYNKVIYRRCIARREHLIRPINVVGWVLFSLIVAHFIVEGYAASLAFISPTDGSPLPPNGLTYAENFYSQLDHPTNVLYSGLYVAITVVADGFLIYRLHIVWDGNRYVPILPLFLSSGLLVTGSVVTYLFQHARQSIFGIARRWILACFVLTFLCNLYSTSFLAYRLWVVERFVHNSDTLKTESVLHKIFEIIIQSAAIYCVLVMLSLALMVVSSNMIFITVAITIPTIGIIFSLIVIRTHCDQLVTHVQCHADIEFNLESVDRSSSSCESLQSFQQTHQCPHNLITPSKLPDDSNARC